MTVAHRRFGILCVLVYVMLSWAARSDMRLGEQNSSLIYPLDTFSMYARMPGYDRGHLLVRDRQGAVHRVTAFHSFDCAEPLIGDTASCAGRRGIPYVYEDLVRYIQAHRGPGTQEVELITRMWEIRPGSAPVQEADCLVAHCKVAR